MNLADQIIDYLFSLKLDIPLPDEIRVMNPYQESEIQDIVRRFYQQFYSDKAPRKLILAINPGRLGAGATGIPFTDTKRLRDVCHIESTIPETHELSSVFVYDMIKAYGGPKKFYNDFFIGSVCPLGFLKKNERGNWVNFNYYDETAFARQITPFIVTELNRLLKLQLKRTTCICWGTGKNYAFLKKLNADYGFFEQILSLEHPRFIMQYRAKQKQRFIKKYLNTFSKAM